MALSAQELESKIVDAYRCSRASERRYAVSERVIATVSFGAREDDHMMVIFHWHRRRDLDGWFEITECTPAEFAKLAEIRSMVDAWLDGKLPSLPPSTAPSLPPSTAPAEVGDD